MWKVMLVLYSFLQLVFTTVKHVYFAYLASIKFSRFSQYEQNHEIKYAQIFGIAHHGFIWIEYQHFCDMICNILGIM